MPAALSASSPARQRRREGHIGRRARTARFFFRKCKRRSLRRGRDVGLCTALVDVEDGIDNLDDAVGDEQIRLDDAPRVDIDVVDKTCHTNPRSLLVTRRQSRAVHEVRRPQHPPRHEVVSQHTAQLLATHGFEPSPEPLPRSVVWCQDR
ncbi:hypothetical protein HYQ46_003087 [Verticillium longisporum]|nr:hypothetical protein HYQ46_003087 [Verticillium longisporum]